ncbi:hypothetical protein ACFLUF_00110 [Chloroflexota bacterium]
MKLFDLNLRRTEISIILVYFGYLLYYVGRRYIEGYYEVLGIPTYLLQFQFHDYIYAGAHPIQLIIAVAFILLLVGLFRFRSIEIVENNDKEQNISFWRKLWNTLRKRQSRENLFTLIFFLYEFPLGTLALLYIVFLWMLTSPRSPEPYPPQIGIAYATIIFVLLTAGMGIIAIWVDRFIVSYIRKHKFLTNYFYFATIIILIVMPHFGAFSWGILTGGFNIGTTTIESHFNRIEIISLEPINQELDWEKEENGLYNIASQQYLIFESKDFLFVKPQNDVLKTISIPKSQIISFTLKK